MNQLFTMDRFHHRMVSKRGCVLQMKGLCIDHKSAFLMLYRVAKGVDDVSEVEDSGCEAGTVRLAFLRMVKDLREQWLVTKTPEYKNWQ